MRRLQLVPVMAITLFALAGVAHAKKFPPCPSGRFVVSPAEDRHLVGDLRPGREHEPFRMSIRAGFGAGSSRPRYQRRPGLRQAMR